MPRTRELYPVSDPAELVERVRPLIFMSVLEQSMQILPTDTELHVPGYQTAKKGINTRDNTVWSLLYKDRSFSTGAVKAWPIDESDSTTVYLRARRIPLLDDDHKPINDERGRMKRFSVDLFDDPESLRWQRAAASTLNLILPGSKAGRTEEPAIATVDTFPINPYIAQQRLLDVANLLTDFSYISGEINAVPIPPSDEIWLPSHRSLESELVT